MVQAAHLRAMMEEEEIKGMLQKKQGRNEEFEHALEQNDELANMKFHKLDATVLLQEMGTNEKTGLTEEQAAAQIIKVGPNRLEEKAQLPWFVKLLLEMVGIFSILLWAGAALCFAAYAVQPVDPSNVLMNFCLISNGLFRQQNSNIADSCIWA
jgi:magnesium-transporting ATPase (P-type)